MKRAERGPGSRFGRLRSMGLDDYLVTQEKNDAQKVMRRVHVYDVSDIPWQREPLREAIIIWSTVEQRPAVVERKFGA